MKQNLKLNFLFLLFLPLSLVAFLLFFFFPEYIPLSLLLVSALLITLVHFIRKVRGDYETTTLENKVSYHRNMVRLLFSPILVALCITVYYWLIPESSTIKSNFPIVLLADFFFIPVAIALLIGVSHHNKIIKNILAPKVESKGISGASVASHSEAEDNTITESLAVSGAVAQADVIEGKPIATAAPSLSSLNFSVLGKLMLSIAAVNFLIVFLSERWNYIAIGLFGISGIVFLVIGIVMLTSSLFMRK